MELILKVTSTSPRLPLSQLVRLPMGLDVWEVKPDHAVLQASEAQAERLRQLGYGVEQLRVTEEYLSTFATAETTALYHSAETLEQDLRRLAEQRPEIAELREIGRSLEDRPIWALRIGERKESTHKVLFVGCHHAREWISVEVPYLLAQHLVEHADEVERWLTRGEIWVVPMVNPDGHEYSRTTPTQRLWRKNRRPNSDGSWGVDLNRNYGYMWGILNTNTSSHTPADDTYVGPRAFSEPETRAIRDLVGRVSFGGIVTYHSYSQLVLWPWGYTGEPIDIDEDRDRMANLGTRMREIMQSVHGTVYEAKQSSKLYPTAGDTTDWTFGIYGMPSLTVELRPRSYAEGGFVLPPSQIQPTWEENKPAALEFIGQVLEGELRPAWTLRQGLDGRPAMGVHLEVEKGRDVPTSDSHGMPSPPESGVAEGSPGAAADEALPFR